MRKGYGTLRFAAVAPLISKILKYVGSLAWASECGVRVLDEGQMFMSRCLWCPDAGE